jgi:hypothetical protein
MAEQPSTQGSLACSDLTGNHDEPTPLADPIQQVSEGLLVCLAQIEELGIGCYGEGLLMNTVERAIHNRISIPLFLNTTKGS